MASYPYNRTINIEEKAAAKEKNKRLFPDILSGSRLKEYFYPLAAKEKKYRQVAISNKEEETCHF